MKEGKMIVPIWNDVEKGKNFNELQAKIWEIATKENLRNFSKKIEKHGVFIQNFLYTRDSSSSVKGLKRLRVLRIDFEPLFRDLLGNKW